MLSNTAHVFMDFPCKEVRLECCVSEVLLIAWLMFQANKLPYKPLMVSIDYYSKVGAKGVSHSLSSTKNVTTFIACVHLLAL